MSDRYEVEYADPQGRNREIAVDADSVGEARAEAAARLALTHGGEPATVGGAWRVS